MRTFNTPAQASAFETKYVMRPFTWPPTTHDAPTLWERAKAMFSALTTRFGSAMRLACRRFLTPQQRRDLILHLEPVEKLVRVLMIVEAITLLITTPIGLKLRQTTKPCRIPDPPPQVGAHKPHPEANRIQAAMMTIAAHQPRIDPRVAEREAREKEQARVAALQLQRQRFDDYDPAALTSRFSVIHWAHDPATRTAPSTLPRSLILDDLTGPLLPLARRIASIPREHFEAPWPRRPLGPSLPRILQRLHPGEARLRRPRPSLWKAAPGSGIVGTAWLSPGIANACAAEGQARVRQIPPTGERSHPSESKTSPSCELA